MRVVYPRLAGARLISVWRLAAARACAAGALILAFGIAGAGSAAALDYLQVSVLPDRAVPSACFSFSTELPRGKTQALDPFVSIAPPIDYSLEARGKDLCVGGLKHGATYVVTMKAGLQAADGTTLPKTVVVPVQVPDREQTVFFDKGKTLLPFKQGVGLPLRSVNVAKAHLTLYRFSDRTMVDHLFDDWFGHAVSFYNLDTVSDRSTKLFEGSVVITGPRNIQVSTTLAIDRLVKRIEPGVYVMIATTDTDRLDRDKERATQWFSVSDIGLTSVKTDSGMLVSAHSLQSGAPLANVDLRLIAQSNEMLGTWKTDASGYITIPAGLLRGEHGNAPKVVAATDASGGFTWIQVDAPALDLTDLDIKGRAPPGPNDAFLWSDRGVYRPGETVHLGLMLRDGDAQALPDMPVSLHIVRPDGVEVEKRPLALSSAGAGTLDINMADNAFSGTWRFWASAGGSDHIGDLSVSVQDFVPPRLDAKLMLPAGATAADGSVEADVAANYFYGSPGAGLTGSLEGTLQAAATPFPSLPGYSFGLVQEPFLPKALSTESFTTDDKGNAVATLKSDDLPDTSVPLEVSVRATVNDVDGRPAIDSATRLIHTADRFIGVKPRFNELSDGATAEFDVALVDGDGHALSAESLKWELVREDYTYNYFLRDGRWQSNETITDARVNGGELALDASGRGAISVQVTSGRWRVEVYDGSGRTATSLRFEAGWWAQSEGENRKPEVMQVSIDAHPPAGKVRAMVEPSFAGRVLVMLDGNGLHGVQDLAMPKGGGAVEFDAKDVPAAGAYVLAIAVSPAGAVVPRLPVRAVGLAWVPGAAAAHRLDVALTAPDTIRPQTALSVGVDVKGADAGEETYVTLAAVDEAVLRMTAFVSPDPADHYLGRRAPSFELRDVYGQLIDPAGQPGQVSQGGDGNANLKTGGIDVKTFKTVALFRGPVKLDAQGHATIAVNVPDFSGRLRLMAVAWTPRRYGKAERPVTVRPPLLAELTLPRFLAPGDAAQARILITVLEAPEQTYTVALTTRGAVSLNRSDALFEDVKRDKRRYVDRTLTAAAVPGVGRIHMKVSGADGFSVERDFEIAVRTPNPFVTQNRLVTLAPKQALAIDDALGQGLVPGSAKLEIAASTLPAFDVPGLYAALRRYPYGCTEQTISRAFPELFAKRLGVRQAASVADAVTPQGAIQRLYSLQASDGSFGYWTSFDTGNFWLTAYAVDFMQHARTEGYSVPEQMESRAVAWLAGRFGSVDTSPQDVAGAAYAAIVLSHADKLDLSQLRYVATRVGTHLPSDIARIQLAAALAHVGEVDLARELVQAASITRNPSVYLNDYGSGLRDQAMMLSLNAEEKLVPQGKMLDRAIDLSRGASATIWQSTQEQAWLLRAAYDLHATTPLDVQLNGKANKPGDTRMTASMPLNQGKASRVVNNGQSPIYVSLAATGIPIGLQPAEARGFSLARAYFHLDGQPADLKDVHQNDELIVVVSGAMNEKFQRKILAVDMLPAGLEPETIGLASSHDDGQFAWLKDLTEPTFYSLRDDRYLAGIDLTEGAPNFKFAYVVRAVTPGVFVNPGSQVEDMYAPGVHARGASTMLDVKAARRPAAPSEGGKVHLKSP